MENEKHAPVNVTQDKANDSIIVTQYKCAYNCVTRQMHQLTEDKRTCDSFSRQMHLQLLQKANAFHLINMQELKEGLAVRRKMKKLDIQLWTMCNDLF